MDNEAGREQWPRPRETQEHFHERCVAGLMAGGMSEDKADSVCSAKWRDANKAIDGIPNWPWHRSALGETLARAFDPDQPRNEQKREGDQ